MWTVEYYSAMKMEELPVLCSNLDDSHLRDGKEGRRRRAILYDLFI